MRAGEKLAGATEHIEFAAVDDEFDQIVSAQLRKCRQSALLFPPRANTAA
jgi:hypothetical protein